MKSRRATTVKATATLPTPVLAGELLSLAEEFRRAYRDLPKSPPPSWPRYFMLCHAVELLLKSHIARCNTKRTEAQLKKSLEKKFGHKLKKLLNRTVALGISVSDRVKEDIGYLDEVHTKYWARYPRAVSTPVVLIEECEPSVEELFKRIRPHL